MDNFTIDQIQPLQKYILVQPIGRPTETSTGFVMPEEGYSPTPVVGKVLAVGEMSQFKIGQTVFFRRYSVDELKFVSPDGQNQIVSLLGDDEVVAIIKS